MPVDLKKFDELHRDAVYVSSVMRERGTPGIDLWHSTIDSAWPDISRRLALLEETVRRAHDCISGEFDHAAEDVSCLSLKAMKHELHAVIVTRVPSTEDQSNG